MQHIWYLKKQGGITERLKKNGGAFLNSLDA